MNQIQELQKQNVTITTEKKQAITDFEVKIAQMQQVRETTLQEIEQHKKENLKLEEQLVEVSGKLMMLNGVKEELQKR